MVFVYVRNPDRYTYDPQYITGTPSKLTDWGEKEESRLFPITVTAKDAAGNTTTSTFNITILRDSDNDGIPDTTDTDDDNDGILDSADANPKVFDALAVTVAPEYLQVIDGKAIQDLTITENKTAAQTLVYPSGIAGLTVNETTNTITGTLTNLAWSNDPLAANYETQNVAVMVNSVGVNAADTDSDAVTITVLRDTDKDGIPDTLDADDDGDGILDTDDPEPKVADTTAPLAPVINNVFANAATVTGTGEAGTTVKVTFPDGKTAEGTVGPDGKWSVTVPVGTTLVIGDTLKANLTDAAGNTSPDSSATVIGMNTVYDPLAKLETVEKGDPNLTYNLKDNISNLSSLPAGTTVTDAAGGNVDINKVGTYTGKVNVNYPDGTSDLIDVPVKVEDTTSPLPPTFNTVVALAETCIPQCHPNHRQGGTRRDAGGYLPRRLEI
jgi:Rib/alpha/Esp surface antigen-like repeat protein